MRRTVGALIELIRGVRSPDPPPVSGSPEPAIGSHAAAMVRRTPLEEAMIRMPWLLLTMLIELCAGGVVAHFNEVLKQVILLASFMPIISAISGNVGLQAAAIVVRALDTGHVRPKHWGRSLMKEVWATLVMAFVCGTILGTVGSVWSKHWTFGVVVAAAMGASSLTAATMGTLFPILSKRMGFDPAATAGPMETSCQDVVGFGVSLWLASLLLRYLH